MTRTSLRCWVAFALLAALASTAVNADEPDSLSVQITSPLGRTGIPGTIRIVARVRNASEDAPTRVRFYVDDALIAELSEGPPYAVP